MYNIKKAGPEDARLLTELGSQTFKESHGHSASEEIINTYVINHFNLTHFRTDLENEKNIFFIIYYNNRPAGYSKIILDHPDEGNSHNHFAKLDRIYILKEFYELGLGRELFLRNAELSRQSGQKGIWLSVWIENKRAIKFYERCGFKIIGKYDFKLSEDHFNPNHIMMLYF